jgi:hypothetical protein
MSIETLQHLEREIARLYALQADVLVAVASARPVVDEFALLDPVSDDERRIRIEDAVREEVAAALRWSSSMAQSRIDQARLLAGPLGQVRDALLVGEVSPRHVGVIVDAAGRLPGAIDRFRRGRDGLPDGRAITAQAEFGAACAELQRRVLPTARRSTVARTRQAARRAVMLIDAEGERRRQEQARCTRNVHVSDDLDGLSTLVARLASQDAHAVMAIVNALAGGDDHPELTVGERRAEALAALVLARGMGSRSADGTALRVQARVDVVVDLPTLLGLADHPGELAGGGTAVPVSVDGIREILADPRIDVSLRRLVVDPLSGHLLDVGRRSYRVPDSLRRFLAARDGVCRFPGCGRRADRCQVDHAVGWDDDGCTDIANLGALCVRHHQLKTHSGWDILESRADGSCIWRSPQGRIYQHRARRLLHPAPWEDPDPTPLLGSGLGPAMEPDPPPF